jgi:esterase/lipase
MLEEIWVRDAVELVWEARRLRRLKASVFEVGAHEGLARVLRPFVDSLEADELAEKWLRRHRKLKEVDERLAAAGLSMDAVMAETLASRLDDVERIERLIATVEARLAAALREIDRHRAVLAERLRGATQEIADAEYKELPAPKAAA